MKPQKAALRDRKIAQFEAKIGYSFASAELLKRALTHASVRSGRDSRPDNERLEFIGDRVLGLAIAEMLCEAFPAAKEGEIARRFNRLVRGEACAAVARTLELGGHLILGDSEDDSGGRDKDTILADAMEAVLGAVFVEAGYDRARAVVRSLWGPTMSQLPQVAADAKSALQEWAQAQGLELPHYAEVARSGPDHAPMFVSEVRITGKTPARGEGASKRAAEQSAATVLLAREGVWSEGASG